MAVCDSRKLVVQGPVGGATRLSGPLPAHPGASLSPSYPEPQPTAHSPTLQEGACHWDSPSPLCFLYCLSSFSASSSASRTASSSCWSHLPSVTPARRGGIVAPAGAPAAASAAAPAAAAPVTAAAGAARPAAPRAKARTSAATAAVSAALVAPRAASGLPFMLSCCCPGGGVRCRRRSCCCCRGAWLRRLPLLLLSSVKLGTDLTALSCCSCCWYCRDGALPLPPVREEGRRPPAPWAAATAARRPTRAPTAICLTTCCIPDKRWLASETLGAVGGRRAVCVAVEQLMHAMDKMAGVSRNCWAVLWSSRQGSSPASSQLSKASSAGLKAPLPVVPALL